MPEVVMPQLGETVTEGTVTRWFKSVGDPVARDEPLFEVSTDKVDSEVPAPASGTLAEIRVPEGDTVDVGVVLAVIAEGAPGENPAPATPMPGTPAAVGATPPPAAAAPAPVAPAPAAAAPAPVAPAPAAAAPAPLAPSGPAPAPAPVAGPAAPAPRPGPGAGAGGNGTAPPLLSPVVRRLLADNGIDPSEVVGTGPGGRITRDDVLAVVDARRSGGVPATAPVATAVPAAPPAAAPVAPAVPAAVPAAAPVVAPAAPGPAAAPVGAAPAFVPSRPAGDDQLVPFTNIRRRTAEHMVRSKATSAHTLVVAEADFEAVERVRRAHGERFRSEEGFALTYLPFVARATVEALHHWPHLNASVGDDALVVHRRVNLAIAVDLSFEGLVAPVIHDADELTVRGLARRIRDVAERARSKRLSPDDLAGGSFTITNPGPFGTLMTGPIINQPQIGILSTDTVKRRPVAVTLNDGSEAVAIHSVGLLSLTWDHRAVDGAYAAAFLHDIAEMLTGHDWPAEL